MGCVRSALDGAPCCPAGNRSRQMQGPGRAYRQTLSVLAVAAPVAGECRESYKMAFVRSQMVIVSNALGGASSLLGNRSCQGQGVNGTSRQNLSGLAVAAPAADECRESCQTGSVRSALAGAVLELGQRRPQTPQVPDTCWAVDPRLARFGRELLWRSLWTRLQLTRAAGDACWLPRPGRVCKCWLRALLPLTRAGRGSWRALRRGPAARRRNVAIEIRRRAARNRLHTVNRTALAVQIPKHWSPVAEAIQLGG